VSDRLFSGDYLRFVVPVLAVMVLLGSAIYTGRGMRSFQEGEEITHAAADVRAELNHLAALENGAEAGEPAPISEVEAARAALDDRIDVAVSWLPADEAAELQRDIDDFASAAARTARAYSEGDLELADSLDDDQTDPLFGELQVALRTIEHDAEERAHSVGRGAMLSLVLATAVAVVGILALFAVQGRNRSRLAEQRTRAELASRHRALVENSPIQTYVLDDSGQIEFASAAAERALGDIATDIEKVLRAISPEYRDFGEHLRARTISFDIPHILRAEATGQWYEATVSDQRSNPAIRGLVISVSDVSDRMEMEALLRRQASEDSLTGLPNRRGLQDIVTKTLARSARRESAVALLLIDIDGFKGVNDTLGHPVGDELLKQVASRLRETCRADEQVARLGGDEFAQVIEVIDDEVEVEMAAERIIDSMRVPFDVEGQLLAIKASIGIALGTADVDMDTLFRYADIALYESKRGGGGRSCVFASEMEDLLLGQARLQREMEPGFVRGEFSLAYQPLIAVSDQHPTGFEALMRWTSPALGQVSPASFIPVAEKSGLIVRLGRWAVREAAQQLAAWQEDFGDRDLVMSVNASVVELIEEGFVEHLASVIEDTGIDPRTFQVEVTESILADDGSSIVERLESIRAMGVRVALDDFGTGYSSMSQLQALPVDCLKIDRAFIQAIGDDDRAARVVYVLIELGRALDLVVVAEGVEENAQLEALKARRCDLAQGFMVSRPMPPEDVAEFISNYRSKLAQGRMDLFGSVAE